MSDWLTLLQQAVADDPPARVPTAVALTERTSR